MSKFRQGISRFIILIVLAALLVPSQIGLVFAEESASVKAAGGSATKGETITVKVTVASSVDMEMYEYALTYDTGYLQYVSGDADREDNGKLTVIKYDASGKSQTLSFKFKTLKVGETSVQVGGATVCPSDPKYGDSLKVSVSNGKVTVKAPYQASSDCNLKSLQVSEGTLSPAFSKSTTEYSMEVGGGCNSLKITAVANDSKASVKVSGNKDLKEGSNTVKIVVTAENGDTKTYKINVTRGKMSPTPTPTVGAMVDVGDQKLTISDVIHAAFPEGFEKSSMEYQDFPVECLVNMAGNLTLVEMSDGKLYVYNAEKNSFSPYTEVSGKVYPIILLDTDAATGIPEGYSAVSRNFAGADRIVYQVGEESNYFLFWGMNGEGNANWYQYYIPAQSIQLWNQEQISVTPTPVPTSTPTMTPTPTVSPIPTEAVITPVQESTPQEKKDNLRFLGWIVAGFSGLLALLFLALFLKEKNNKAEGQETESEETEFMIADSEYAKAVDSEEQVSIGDDVRLAETVKEEIPSVETVPTVPSVEKVPVVPSADAEPLPEIIVPAEEDFSAGEPEGQPVTINIENTEEVSRSLANVLLQEIEKMEKEDNNSN